MFSGIVETIGRVKQLYFKNDCLNLCIYPHHILSDLKIGDSIAINGVCLTITALSDNNFYVTVVPETLRKTNLKNLSIKSRVNLERSIKITDRIHGHFVQGHIDSVGEIIEIIQDSIDAFLIKIKIPPSLQRYIVKKGYISLDGMSITIIESLEDWLSITLIPHTKEITIADGYRVGSLINIEVDILGKYIEKIFMEHNHASIS